MAVSDPRSTPRLPEPRPRFGLRVRLWLGGLGGVVVAGLGLGWVLLADPEFAGALLPRIAEAVGAGLVVGVLLAIWLDRGVVGRVRDLADGLSAGQIREPGEGWGELGELSFMLQSLLTRQRQLLRSAEELLLAQRQIGELWEAVDRWASSEHWQPPAIAEGPLGVLGEALDRGLARDRQVRGQNCEAARQVHADLLRMMEEARGVGEQSEHGFVEATAMLTTVHELQRLAAEIQQSLAATPAGESDAAARAYEQWRSAAAAAIEELVQASSESVQHLGAGLERVQDIGEQVQTLANRAILLALNVVLTGGQPEPEAGRTASAPGELRQLAREVRAATDRVAELARQVTEQVRAASDRMRGIRERVALRLEQAPAPPEFGKPGPSEDTLRLLSRLREMVQDAARKGERLSAAGEGASRSAQELVRRLDGEAQDLEGLVVRLSPTGNGHDADQAPQERPSDSSSGGDLRLLGDEEPGDDAIGEDREGRS